MADVGRPPKFKPEFVEQAEKLCRLGATDIELAEVFSNYCEDLYLTVWLRIHREDRFGVIAVRKSKQACRKRLIRKNPSERIRNAMSARMWAAIKGRVDGALFSRLGYSANELKSHLESRFQPGMSWLNYGSWHIDHRQPCASFDQTDRDQFAQCWSLDNLQPLWASDNVKKGAKHGAP